MPYTKLMGGDSVQITMTPTRTRVLEAVAVARGKIELKDVLASKAAGKKGDIVEVHIVEKGSEGKPLLIIKSNSPEGSLNVESKY